MDTSGFCKGPDVSHFDGAGNWKQALTDGGIAFGFCKATEGLTDIDPLLVTNWPAMSAAGITRGAFHFLSPALSGEAQADYCLAAIDAAGGRLATDLPITVDLESLAGIDSAGLVACARAFVARINAVTGRTPIVYASPAFANENGLGSAFGDYPLWVAEYEVAAPHVPEGWADWTFWQYAAGEDGGHNLPGWAGSLDMNYFQGSHADLLTRFGI